MTSCVITDKRSRRVRNFLFPKSFFPARGGEIFFWGGGRFCPEEGSSSSCSM